MRTNKVAGAAFAMALMLSPVAAMADELRAVSTTNVGDAAEVNKIEAKSGPGGAGVKTSSEAIKEHADGSVSSSERKESLKSDFTGTSRKSEASSTMVSPDGSMSSVKEEVRSAH